MNKRTIVAGCGAYLPERLVKNKELAEKVGSTDEWIVQRTGIHQRYVAAENEKTSDLAVAAAKKALEHAGITADQLDLIIVATTTPDNTFPACATRVQHLLGAHKAAAFDMQAVCSGFVYALATADSFIRSGQYNTILIIGAETITRLLDYQDRTTCVLFGDGAGAFVLQSADAANKQGIEAVTIHADGAYQNLLYVDGGAGYIQPFLMSAENNNDIKIAESDKAIGHLRMNGREVYRHAVEKLSASVAEVLQKASVTAEDVDWLVPHQANVRIIEHVGKNIALDPAKVVIMIQEHANTSAASIPLAFCAAVADGRIKRGQRVVLDAMGGGFTWGAAVLVY